MTAKTNKPDSFARANKRMHKQLLANTERLAQVKTEFLKYKRDTHEMLTSEIAARRRITDTVANNNVTITELQQQQANQFQENAELRQDLGRARQLYSDARESHARLQETITMLQADRDRLMSELTAAYLQINQKPEPSLFDRVFGRF